MPPTAARPSASQSQRLCREGEAARISQAGLAEAADFLQKSKASGDARLLSLNHLSDQCSKSTQPLVPERVFITGRGEDGEGQSLNLINPLVSLLISKKSGIQIAGGNPGLTEFKTTIATGQAKAVAAAKGWV